MRARSPSSDGVEAWTFYGGVGSGDEPLDDFLRRARLTVAAEVELDPDAQDSAADARRA